MLLCRNGASPKFDNKSPNSRSEKAGGVERKIIRRSKSVKMDEWYKKAEQLITISAKA